MASGAVAVGGGSGLATASPTERVEVNVGFDAPSGRAAAVDAASEVVREFAFDALTIRVPKTAVAGLRNRPDVRYVEGERNDARARPDAPVGRRPRRRRRRPRRR